MFSHRYRTLAPTDILMIGGGIMCATLASMLAVLQPDWRTTVVERGSGVAEESSNAWNNAGTGHSGYCELNYMPDPNDPANAVGIAEQFLATRQWWSYLADNGLVDPSRFVSATPHLDVVFGKSNITYLRRRYETLKRQPYFAGIEYSEDRAQIARWAPLVMADRHSEETVAATRVANGTDVDFGALTREMFAASTRTGGTVICDHEISTLHRNSQGGWVARGQTSDGERYEITARFVFVGAGGKALTLLQRAHVDEVRGYGVLPVGAAFFRCANPSVVQQHRAKVYGQAPLGAPPMSVPHLDARVVDGTPYLMFGPYATFSTKLLAHGTWTDFFATLRWHNLRTLSAAGRDNLALVRYLVSQLIARESTKFAQLQRFYPGADPADWDMIAAGQRAQLVTPDADRGGVLRTGTELVVSADRSIAGVLGASPGASTAVPIMIEVLRRAFPDLWLEQWQQVMTAAVPAQSNPPRTTDGVHDALAATACSLGLDGPGAQPSVSA